MRNQEYEDAYNDARHVVYRRGKRGGAPVCGPDGIRYCPVDGFLLADRDVLKEAWGESMADEILVAAESDSLHCCHEGNRLWQRYVDATKCNVRVLIQQQIAENNANS